MYTVHVNSILLLSFYNINAKVRLDHSREFVDTNQSYNVIFCTPL